MNQLKTAMRIRIRRCLPIGFRGSFERILASPAFRATDAQKAFLEFVVKKMLAGESEEIKGYTVATRVFGRREDFDQATDPIVSIQANKLRRALEHYYLTAGKQGPRSHRDSQGQLRTQFHRTNRRPFPFGAAGRRT